MIFLNSSSHENYLLSDRPFLIIMSVLPVFAVNIVELGPPLVVRVWHLSVDVVEELASDGGAARR